MNWHIYRDSRWGYGSTFCGLADPTPPKTIEFAAAWHSGAPLCPHCVDKLCYELQSRCGR